MSFIYDHAKTWDQADLSGILSFVQRQFASGADLVVAGCTEIEMAVARCGGDQPSVLFPLLLAAETFVADWTSG